MISAEYASRQLSGVWKMAWNRPDWAESLDRSVDGVFNSFWAAAFVSPIAILGFISARRAVEKIPNLATSPILEMPFSISVSIEFVAYLAGWGAGLAALIFFARSMRTTQRVGDLIIGYNWLQVFAAVGQATPLVVLSVTGRSEIAAILALPVMILIIALYVGVLRRGSDAGVGLVVAMFAWLIFARFIASSAITSIGFGLYTAFS